MFLLAHALTWHVLGVEPPRRTLPVGAFFDIWGRYERFTTLAEGKNLKHEGGSRSSTRFL